MDETDDDIRWKERFENFCKALARLESALQQKDFSILEKDGVIKRFEFTVELAWKTLQDLLNERGHPKVKGPKPVIKQAFKDEIIDDGQSWINMLDDRNKSTHLYDENMSVEVFDKIQNQYFALLTGFKNHILQEEDE
ncbi:MAG: nucleotidyltransferase substrate binding protein [Bacteroidota bacterium]|nr:nucleotidyltransferase substrate binding protein [Bacteroidota bacterium]